MITSSQADGLAQSQAMVVVNDLKKSYYPSPRWMRFLVRSPITSEVVALRGVSFEVKKGDICIVMGPNGAGKTTAFRILVGLTTPSGGTAQVMGLDAHEESLEVRRLIGWMPTEDRSLLMRLTCYENLHFHGRLQGMKGPDLRSRITETLELVGIGHAAQHSVFALSAGMRARLQLARALLHRPRVLVLDEPTAFVDPVGSYELIQTIMNVVEEEGLAALVSSHRLDEVEALDSQVVLLDKGSVRYKGTLDNMRPQLDRRVLQIALSDLGLAAEAKTLLKDRPEVEEVVAEGSMVRCVMAPHVSAGAVLTHLQPVMRAIDDVREVRAPLRELIQDMYQRRDGAATS